jgi:hypothetical protein
MEVINTRQNGHANIQIGVFYYSNLLSKNEIK